MNNPAFPNNSGPLTGELARLFGLKEPGTGDNEAANITGVRQELLRAFLREIPNSLNASLWLTDVDGYGPRLTLWAEAYKDREDASAPSMRLFTRLRSTRLFRTLLSVERQTSLGENLGFSPLPPALHEKIAILRKRSSGANLKLVFVPIVDSADQDQGTVGLIGLILIHAREMLTQDVNSVAMQFNSCLVLAQSLGAWLRFNRQSRVLSALREFQNNIQNITDPVKVCSVAAKTLQRWASADYCCVYTHKKDPGLQRLADALEFCQPKNVDQRSLISAIHFGVTENLAHKSAYRVADINDARERALVFGVDAPWALNELDKRYPSDRPLSAMILRLVSSGIKLGGPGNNVPFLSIRMFTRERRDFPGGIFSQTDQLILETIGAYLSDIAPGLFLRTKMGTLNEVLAKRSPLAEASLTEDTPVVDKRYFAKLLEEASDNVRKCYIAEKVTKTAYAVPVITNSDGHVEPGLGPIMRNVSLQHKLHISEVGGRYFLSHILLDEHDQSVGLICEIPTPFLVEHEASLVDRVSAELRLALLRGSDAPARTHRLAEIRHILRASLDAISGSAASLVARYQRASLLPQDEAYQLLFGQARFRKDFERLQLAADDLSVLFENARILLDDMNRSLLTIRSVDVAELLKDRIGLFRPETERRGLSINFSNQYPETLPDPRGDRGLLNIFVYNILDNAIKYSHHGEDIAIRLWASGAAWCLSIDNVGQYIPYEQRDRIFEPYARVGPAKGQKTRPGTGLGLPAVKKILMLHSHSYRIEVGSIPLERVKDQVTKARTTFTFMLPRRSDDKTGDGS